MTTRQSKTRTRGGRRTDDTPRQRSLQPAAEITFAFVPTLEGARSLLDGVSARLPTQAPPAPPRKGTAWWEGYAAGVADAQDVITWVRDGLQLHGNSGSAPQTTAQGDNAMTTTEPTDTTGATTDFPWIRAWGQMVGSQQWYVDDQVAIARAESAPDTATYRREAGDWATIDDIVSLDTRRRLGLGSTVYAILMTAHHHASEAQRSVSATLDTVRGVEVPDDLAIERSRAVHDLDRAARALVSAQGRVRDLAEKARAEGC